MAANVVLIADWLAARSLARGLPPPIVDRGGLRVDTGSDDEITRWVFASPTGAITALTAAIRQPGYRVKLAGSSDMLRLLLADGWRVEEQNCMMVLDAPVCASAALPAGYTWLERTHGAVVHLRIMTGEGLLAASGYAAASGNAFITIAS